MAIYLTDHKRTHELTREQVQRLVNWMHTCKAVMEGYTIEDGPKDAAEAQQASLATRKVLEADGCHLNFEDGHFHAVRGYIR